ncbi:hypothetical protein LJPFL01_1913 [Lelliottia jeotgali]|nr:hypothetical protein LJPFL01_1913 [Lelliottia jeotgali]
MKKIVVISLGCLLLTGCSAKYNNVSVTKNTEQLARNKPVSIATPVDGIYETTTYRGSGSTTAQTTKAAFERYSNEVLAVPECSGLECLKDKGKLNEGYYVVPQILHWEDRATEWSGIPDKMEVKITVYDAKTSSVISSTILSGKSKWATFGGDHPQDLLPEPINNYVSSLY